jgi:DNA-binding response OmpR family regulator
MSEKILSGNRILIVEDEPIFLKNIAASLRREGYEVTEATNGADAWKILSVASIDLLILDVGLPDYDGLDLLRAVRTIHPWLPAVVMTARDSLEVENRAIESGASVFFTKPIALRALKEKIRTMEGKRNTERSGSER